MSTCLFDKNTFIWTEGGYKNADSFTDQKFVRSMVSGTETLVPIEKVKYDRYTGDLVTVSDSGGRTLFSVTESQRVVWNDRYGKPQISTAKEFLTKINIDGWGYIFSAPSGSSTRSGTYKILSDNVYINNVVDHLVWGVRTKHDNIVIKSESSPIVFSDIG